MSADLTDISCKKPILPNNQIENKIIWAMRVCESCWQFEGDFSSQVAEKEEGRLDAKAGINVLVLKLQKCKFD